LLYNGRTPAELASDGVELKRLTAYVGQMDLHFPALTVRETVTFASQSSVADVKLLQQSSSTQQPGAKIDQELVDMDRKRADMLIELIGLGECADTYCGNDMLRGVSGGQRKVSQLPKANANPQRASSATCFAACAHHHLCACCSAGSLSFLSSA
jgi:ABC-type multidrug transport system ATPase subunit